MQRSTSDFMLAGVTETSTPTQYYTAQTLISHQFNPTTAAEEQQQQQQQLEHAIEIPLTIAPPEEKQENALPHSTKRQVLNAMASIGYFLTSSTILLTIMNFVHERVPTSVAPLPDLGHEIIRKIQPEFLGDVVMISLFVCLGVAVLLSRRRFYILTRFFLAYGTIYFLRITTISATSLPVTENHCYYKYEHISSFAWNTFLGLITFGSANKHCGDLMFSGHTATMTLILLTFWCYFTRRYILNFLLTVLVFIGCVFIIGTRNHYSIDVLVAFYLTTCVYMLTPDHWDGIISKLKVIPNKFLSMVTTTTTTATSTTRSSVHKEEDEDDTKHIVKDIESQI